MRSFIGAPACPPLRDAHLEYEGKSEKEDYTEPKDVEVISAEFSDAERFDKYSKPYDFTNCAESGAKGGVRVFMDS